MIQGERSFDLVVRLQEPYRQNMEAIKNILVATPDNQHLPLSQFADIKVSKGASFIYRESNSRFIGVQFSVEGRDLASAVADARKTVGARPCRCRPATRTTGAANTRSISPRSIADGS